jgi:hypothetical protein
MKNTLRLGVEVFSIVASGLSSAGELEYVDALRRFSPRPLGVS